MRPPPASEVFGTASLPERYRRYRRYRLSHNSRVLIQGDFEQVSCRRSRTRLRYGWGHRDFGRVGWRHSDGLIRSWYVLRLCGGYTDRLRQRRLGWPGRTRRRRIRIGRRRLRVRLIGKGANMRFFAVPRSDVQVRDGARVPRRRHCRRFFRCFRELCGEMGDGGVRRRRIVAVAKTARTSRRSDTPWRRLLPLSHSARSIRSMIH